jgi:hypothetical protein
MVEAEAIVDAEVVEEPVAQESPSTQLVRRERRSEVLRPLDPETLLKSFEEYQGLLQRLLTDEDWQGRPNKQGSFVKKKGWRKIATAFDLDVTVIPGMSRIERDEDGAPIRAEVWMRAIAPSGRTMDGDGYCSVTEPRFAQAGGRQKLENDLRATATTRAKNRAISDLIGMGDVSAEEVDASSNQTGPAFGEAASPEVASSARQAVAWMLGQPVNSTAVTKVMADIESRAGGYLPMIAARAVGHAAAAARDAREQRETTPAGEGDPDAETPRERKEREDAEAAVARVEQEGMLT